MMLWFFCIVSLDAFLFSGTRLRWEDSRVFVLFICFL